jgi:hypothetical protein
VGPRRGRVCVRGRGLGERACVGAVYTCVVAGLGALGWGEAALTGGGELGAGPLCLR